MTDATQLPFRIAPNAIEDLGSNLYTSFPKVLAEFVANAYDADAKLVEISYDFKRAESSRRALQRQMAAEDVSKGDFDIRDYRLPEDIVVEIRDDGFGMSLEDLKERFLYAGRKRRQFAEIKRSTTRPLMGRKGLGKLAGFGIAAVMEVVTKQAGVDHGHRIVLDYDQILQETDLSRVMVDVRTDTSEFKPDQFGTLIILRRLGIDATKSRKSTVLKELADHFAFTDPGEFVIRLCGHKVPRPKPAFAYAWPESEEKSSHELVEESISSEVGDLKFKWRIRFRRDRKALAADRRGVRVYARNRLASPPSLLDADTNMHGFRMTDYMDGVVDADFIDNQKQDYISTDRQSLRWETPLLSPLKEFLSKKIKEACAKYQAVRDAERAKNVKEDQFTLNTIKFSGLSKRESKLAQSIAVRLASYSKKGTEDPQYVKMLPEIVRAIGQGELFAHLATIAQSSDPSIDKLISEVARLNRFELDRSTAVFRARLDAIETLEKYVSQTPVDTKERNEKSFQRIFEEAPWLLNPVFHDYMTADKSLGTTLKNMQKVIGIETDNRAPDVDSAKKSEPDFAFLMSDATSKNVVVVELKASTKTPHYDDIVQINDYMATIEQYLKDNRLGNVQVFGQLVCHIPPRTAASTKSLRRFFQMMDRLKPDDALTIRSYESVLADTRTVHKEWLELGRQLNESPDNDL